MKPLGPEEVEVLYRLARGEPATPGGKAPSAREIVAALRLVVEYTERKPESAINHRVGIVLVNNPYAPAAPAIEVPLLPGATSCPPHLLSE